jgi:hypothetical protein
VKRNGQYPTSFQKKEGRRSRCSKVLVGSPICDTLTWSIDLSPEFHNKREVQVFEHSPRSWHTLVLCWENRGSFTSIQVFGSCCAKTHHLRAGAAGTSETVVVRGYVPGGEGIVIGMFLMENNEQDQTFHFKDVSDPIELLSVELGVTTLYHTSTAFFH